MRFAEPYWLLLLGLLPLLWRVRSSDRRADALKRLGDPASLRSNQSGEPRRRLVKLLAAGAFVLAVLSFAQLEGAPEATVVPGRGLDVLIAVDTSRSMAARDLSPDRLVAARILVESISQRLQGDRMGLIAFSGVAHLQCPFTADLSIFRRYLQQLEPGSLPVGGTDLSQAIDLAIDIFERAGEGDRVLVLLTDGEDHSGEEMKALGSRLQAAGVKTHLVAVGSDLGEPVPDGAGGYLRDRQGRPVVSRTDRDGLEAMQKASGGMLPACSLDRPLRIGSSARFWRWIAKLSAPRVTSADRAGIWAYWLEPGCWARWRGVCRLK